MMSFPAASVGIAPVSFLKYTTYSSKTVVSPMMTKIIGGAERSETADTNSTIKLQQIPFQCKYIHPVIIASSRDNQLESLASSLQHVKCPLTFLPGKVGGGKGLPFTGLVSYTLVWPHQPRQYI